MKSCAKEMPNRGELDKYMSDIKRYEILSSEEEVFITNQISNGDLTLRNKLIESNLRFVVLISHRYQTTNLPISDLVNEGNIGLIKAISLFDPKQGVKFITFAYHHIMGAILTSIYKNGSLIRIPKHIARKRKQIEQLMKYWENPEECSKTSCANFLNENPEDLLFLIRARVMTPKYTDLTKQYEQFIDNDTNINTLDQSWQDLDLKALLDEKLKHLAPKEEYVLRAYFNYFEPQVFTYLALAKELNMTKEGIRVMKNRALLKLRNLISVDEYLEYI